MTRPLNIYPYCNCWARGVAHRHDGYTYDGPSGLWVCARCRKPSKMNYERTLEGKAVIPQGNREIDIFEYERTYESRMLAKKVIRAELDWDDDPELDYDYS